MKCKKGILLGLMLLTLNIWGSMSLDDCKKEALQHNLGIAAQEEIHSAAKCESKAAIADFLPSVTALGNYTHLSDPIIFDLEDQFLDLMNGVEEFSDYLVQAHDSNWAEAELYDPANSPLYNLLSEMYDAGLLDESLEQEIGSQDIWALGLTVSQPLFTGGKLKEKYKITKLAENMTEWELEQKRQEVIFETIHRYWLVVELESKRNLAEKYLETIISYKKDLENYLEEGIITSNDLLKIDVKKNEAELNLLKVENGIALARMALNQMMGMELNSQIELSDDLPDNAEFQRKQSLSETAQELRPELQLLSEGLEISKSLEKITFSRYLPNLMLIGSYNYLNPDPHNSLEAEFGDDWTVGVSAQWEIFNWNQRGNALSAAKHRKKAIEKQFQEAEEMVNLELSQSQYLAEESVVKVSMCERHLTAAQNNLHETEDLFDEGIVKTSEVLEAQTLWFDAESELINAKAEYVLQKAAVAKSAGILK